MDREWMVRVYDKGDPKRFFEANISDLPDSVVELHRLSFSIELFWSKLGNCKVENGVKVIHEYGNE